MKNTRLSVNEIAYIKELSAQGYRQQDIAKMLDRGYSTINRILNDKHNVNKKTTIGRPRTKKDGSPTSTQGALLKIIKKYNDEDVACELTNVEFAERLGIVNASCELSTLAKLEMIHRETKYVDGVMSPMRKIWLTEKGIETVEEIERAEAEAESEAETSPTVETAPTTELTALLNDILQELRALGKKIDANAEISFKQGDNITMYGKAQLDKLTSIAGMLHKEEKE